MALIGRPPKDARVRFMAMVNTSGPVMRDGLGQCWVWTGFRDRKGYGVFSVVVPSRRNVLAHRAALQFSGREIPDGLQVNHHCDNKACVRPEHLYVGTQAENIRDAAMRLRFSTSRRGKLTLEQRLAIMNEPWRRGINTELARQYGVCPQTITDTRRGRFVGSGRYYGQPEAKYQFEEPVLRMGNGINLAKGGR